MVRTAAFFLSLLAIFGFACAAGPEGEMTTKPLAVGDPAPAFTVQSTEGEISLAELRGKQVVLYFYPKDATPG